MEIPKRIDSEGRNWGRWCLVDGESPVPIPFKEASWVRFRKHDETDWDEEEPPPPPPVDYRSARVVQGVYKSLPLVCKHVMCTYWVGNYIYGRPRAEHETVRLLNILAQAKRIDVPEGFQFSYHQYRTDISYIARKMEAAFEIRARSD